MEGLELVATRTAAAQLTPTHLEELNALLERMDNTLKSGNHGEWADLNTQFHCAIAGMTGMPLLQEMTERALNQWERLRYYYLDGALTQRLAQAQAEHHQIVQAMQQQAYPLLERLVREHNQGALAACMEHLAHAAPNVAL